jgi:hypothetical protein
MHENRWGPDNLYECEPRSGSHAAGKRFDAQPNPAVIDHSIRGETDSYGHTSVPPTTGRFLKKCVR